MEKAADLVVTTLRVIQQDVIEIRETVGDY